MMLVDVNGRAITIFFFFLEGVGGRALRDGGDAKDGRKRVMRHLIPRRSGAPHVGPTASIINGYVGSG